MTHVYGASLDVPRIATYDVLNNTSLQLAGSVFARGRCFNRTSAFVLASKRFPHHVFSASWPGPRACGMSSYTNPAGGLMDMAQSWSYGYSSGVRGMAFGWAYGQVLYTADTSGDAIWTHAFGFYGETYYMGRYPLPGGAQPRHIATHPYGKYLYASLDGAGAVGVYLLDPYMGVVKSNDSRYSLIPPGRRLGRPGPVSPANGARRTRPRRLPDVGGHALAEREISLGGRQGPGGNELRRVLVVFPPGRRRLGGQEDVHRAHERHKRGARLDHAGVVGRGVAGGDGFRQRLRADVEDERGQADGRGGRLQHRGAHGPGRHIRRRVL